MAVYAGAGSLSAMVFATLARLIDRAGARQATGLAASL
jgi:hypothetical protein